MKVTLELDTDQAAEIVLTELKWHFESDLLPPKEKKFLKKTIKFYMSEPAFREYIKGLKS